MYKDAINKLFFFCSPETVKTESCAKKTKQNMVDELWWSIFSFKLGLLYGGLEWNSSAPDTKTKIKEQISLLCTLHFSDIKVSNNKKATMASHHKPKQLFIQIRKLDIRHFIASTLKSTEWCLFLTNTIMPLCSNVHISEWKLKKITNKQTKKHFTRTMKDPQSPLLFLFNPNTKSTPDWGWAAFIKCMFSAVCACMYKRNVSVSYLLFFFLLFWSHFMM